MQNQLVVWHRIMISKKRIKNIENLLTFACERMRLIIKN